MILPAGLQGPDFNNCDYLMFNFDGAMLTLPALRLPNNDHNIDDTSIIKDFRGIVTSDWDHDDDTNQAEHLLLLQHWNAENIKSLDDIATCKLWIKLIEMHEPTQAENTLLSKSGFESAMLKFHSENLGTHNETHANNPDMPTFGNCYFGKSITRQHLNWFVVLLPLNSRSKPTQLLMIPINNRFVLMAYIKVQSLHYAGRSNPYSEETLKQFEKDLFDDFLSHIKIEYSPELIEKIQSLKNKMPT